MKVLFNAVITMMRALMIMMFFTAVGTLAMKPPLFSLYE
jgi:hypothetical protein